MQVSTSIPQTALKQRRRGTPPFFFFFFLHILHNNWAFSSNLLLSVWVNLWKFPNFSSHSEGGSCWSKAVCALNRLVCLKDLRHRDGPPANSSIFIWVLIVLAFSQISVVETPHTSALCVYSVLKSVFLGKLSSSFWIETLVPSPTSHHGFINTKLTCSSAISFCYIQIDGI